MHHDGVLIFTHFARAVACCLLLLLAAKPGRSTLDTKKGYKTKTGSTSSVTLTLTLTKCGPCGGVRGTSDVENGWYMERHGLPATI